MDGGWKLVASADRGKHVPGRKYAPVYASGQHDAWTASVLRELLAEHARHEQRIASAFIATASRAD